MNLEHCTCLECGEPVALENGYWSCDCWQVARDYLEAGLTELPDCWYSKEDPAPRCGELGCNKRAIECRITVYHSDVDSLRYFWFLLRDEGLRWMWGLLRDGYADVHEYYCMEHASKHGYCHFCGEFWAGVESFDFGSPPGLCDNCRDQLEHDFDDDDEDWWDWQSEPYFDGLEDDQDDDVVVYGPDAEEDE